MNYTVPLGYSVRVPLFRRKDADLVEDATAPVTEEVSTPTNRPKSYTPSKKELGVATPKRAATGRRVNEPAPANRREAYKQMRTRERSEAVERREGMAAGDEKYLLPRDRGPERSLVRDIVDSRRTVGSWFFGGALVVLVASNVRIPIVSLIGTILWALLAVAVIIDSMLIARKAKRLVLERFPKTTQRLGGLQMYGIMRGLSFRRMRLPKPKVKIGDKV